MMSRERTLKPVLLFIDRSILALFGPSGRPRPKSSNYSRLDVYQSQMLNLGMSRVRFRFWIHLTVNDFLR